MGEGGTSKWQETTVKIRQSGEKGKWVNGECGGVGGEREGSMRGKRREEGGKTHWLQRGGVTGQVDECAGLHHRCHPEAHKGLPQ